MMGAQQPDDRVWIGIDLGGTKILGLLLDQQARVSTRLRRSTPAGGNQAVAEAMIAVAGELVRAATAQGRVVAGVGICSPGFVHDQTGVVIEASNLSVRNLPLGALVMQALDLPTLVLHDVTAAALGEIRFGSARGAQYVACCNIGTGIGMGLVLGGQIYRGSAGRAGEFGHICVVPDGPLCTCGKRGCLEAVASGMALVAQAREVVLRDPGSTLAQLVQNPEHLRVEVIAEAAAQGDDVARTLFSRAASYVGTAIAGLIHTLDLECVVFGGGVVQNGEVFLGPLRDAVRTLVFDEYQGIALPAATLGGDAGAIGAVAALRERA